MKKIILTAGSLVLIFFMSGCVQRQTQPSKKEPAPVSTVSAPSHCRDNLYNKGEEGLDCGWSCPNACQFTEKCGEIDKDETWSGNVSVSCYTTVNDGARLTIEPGTIVKFHHDRDYKTSGRAGLSVNGGDIVARGNKDHMIWFTSDAKDPINGDWMHINIDHSKNSMLDHVIVEFAEIGVSQFDSSVPITNSIIRWINSEGLYAERSTPIIENNTLYNNGYHEIALEQYNTDAVVSRNYFKGGHHGVHFEKSTGVVKNNFFENYRALKTSDPEFTISAGMESAVTIEDNKFQNVGEIIFAIDDNVESTMKNNPIVNGQQPPVFDYDDIRNFELGYIPGDEDDQFPYVYADTDTTRRVTKKIGKDLYFGWSLVYADGALYRFSLGYGEVGKELDLIKLDPETGAVERFGNNDIISPRGLAWDGEFFYVNDGSLKKIFTFKITGGFIEILDSFDIPEAEKGGTAGLTSDGEFLYLVHRYGEKIWKLDKQGQIVGEIPFQTPGGAITYADGYFWVYAGCKKGLCKITKDGELVGEIYPAAKDPWALAWDGTYLWALYRTSETWNDPKIYQMEILDDSLE
ncbi:MAG TPA: hypothetical protein DCY48_00365 [Candidatus Magasanikbacteria bacterium]|nr:MAG: hypothetical protein A3I74_02735 [Candidatus Magasanikbacteria bacterium RIFCSPLOWO2_02_FULL_47_16]OGH79589.1 MAG: hypothetical protein A3C10_00665 [Candidatus Magasanikbacteria bacterium RIFCSPHIGHO2_02_FULL_48_18]HAZ28221.1 hypothetical protein [Candidatus Magasanikbacteria bacterium]